MVMTSATGHKRSTTARPPRLGASMYGRGAATIWVEVVHASFDGCARSTPRIYDPGSERVRNGCHPMRLLRLTPAWILHELKVPARFYLTVQAGVPG